VIVNTGSPSGTLSGRSAVTQLTNDLGYRGTKFSLDVTDGKPDVFDDVVQPRCGNHRLVLADVPSRKRCADEPSETLRVDRLPGETEKKGAAPNHMSAQYRWMRSVGATPEEARANAEAKRRERDARDVAKRQPRAFRFAEDWEFLSVEFTLRRVRG
jgi:hypothetical protein